MSLHWISLNFTFIRLKRLANALHSLQDIFINNRLFAKETFLVSIFFMNLWSSLASVTELQFVQSTRPSRMCARLPTGRPNGSYMPAKTVATCHCSGKLSFVQSAYSANTVQWVAREANNLTNLVIFKYSAFWCNSIPLLFFRLFARSRFGLVNRQKWSKSSTLCLEERFFLWGSLFLSIRTSASEHSLPNFLFWAFTS